LYWELIPGAECSGAETPMSTPLADSSKKEAILARVSRLSRMSASIKKRICPPARRAPRFRQYPASIRRSFLRYRSAPRKEDRPEALPGSLDEKIKDDKEGEAEISQDHEGDFGASANGGIPGLWTEYRPVVYKGDGLISQVR